MLPLVQELPFGLGDRSNRTSGCDDASRVKRVAARLGLVGDDTKVAGDARQRIGGGSKTLQLRVPCVAARATEKHGLREERFAPQCNQAGGVEMARMDSPETHEAVERRQHPQRCLTTLQRTKARSERSSSTPAGSRRDS